MQVEEIKDKAAKLEYAEQCLTTLKLELKVNFLDLFIRQRGFSMMPPCPPPTPIFMHKFILRSSCLWYLTDYSFAGCRVKSGEL